MTMPAQEYFGVRLAGSVRLAIPLETVESVLRINPQRICPIPGVPSSFVGVINQKGSLVWMFDLSQYLSMSASPLTTTPASLLATVLRVSEPLGERERPRLRRLACIVSELDGIYSLSGSQLHPLPQQLKPEIRRLFDGLVSRFAGIDVVTGLVPSPAGCRIGSVLRFSILLLSLPFCRRIRIPMPLMLRLPHPSQLCSLLIPE
ncbi:MAG: chemotaxis protein CheW [Synechococcaceae cyanobacterium SM2_3_1]|nr:chemotaxis protein CheW [Synechococcaceae cyanobacterium SM2_3_1]